jgi:tetratricopeptide (TPR) repeat protein
VKETELDPKQQNLWKKALLANEQKNWEYVVNLTLPLVQQSPLFLEARMLKRRAEGEQAKGVKKGLFGGLGGGGKSVAKMDPWEGIAYLEENVFMKDPFNIKSNQEFYALAMNAGYPDLAAFAMETIRMGHPTNTKLMHELAEHYMRQEQPEKAGDVYRAILKVTPADMVANKGEKDAAAQQSMKTQWGVGGEGGGGGFKSAVKDVKEQRFLELRAKQALTPDDANEYMGMLSAKYDENNPDLNTVKEFGSVYEKIENWSEALAWYTYAQSLNPADTAMIRKIELIQEKVNDLHIKSLEADIENNADAPDIEQRKADLAEIKKQRGQRAVEEAKQRVDRNPTDKAYRFDLGQAYFNCGMFGEAIPELQQARQNPNLRLRALHMLGLCFGAKNMNDLAVSALGDAVKEMPVMDNNKKDILYDLALLFEKVGKTTEHLECLKEIYNHDYGYKDVAKRVEASYG